MQIETKLALATVLSRFHIAVDPNKMPYKSAKEFADSLNTYVTLRREAGVWLNFTPRIAAVSFAKG